MKKGNEYEFIIEKTEFPGFGIAFHEDKKVYIKNAVTGQKLKARVSKKKGGYIEAKTTELIEASAGEIEPKCPHFQYCGGCTHQFITHERQLELKKQQVLTLFEDGGIDDYEFLGIESSPLEYEYRNKMEFTFGDFEKGGELALGMHMPGRAFGIITVDKCMLIDEDMRKVLQTTIEYFKNKELPYYKVMKREGYLRNLVVRKAKNTSQILVNIVTTSQLEFNMEEYKNTLLEQKYEGELAGIIHTFNDSLSDAVIAERVETLYGKDYIIENLLGLNFKITPFSFFQTNSLGAEKLYSIVQDFMGDASGSIVFDLYCGTGTIGQIAAPKAKKVIGVELVEEAVESANENAKLNGLDNCTFIAGDVAKVIQTITDKPDIIILDPPRSGVSPMALDYVIKFDAPEIIYVSCNPKSLVDNLKVLLGNGYKMDKVVLMDMFVHTPHLETVVRLYK
jgi:23S rRNA (uracil-5-)-methyltransferase RumA